MSFVSVLFGETAVLSMLNFRREFSPHLREKERAGLYLCV